MTDIVAGRVTLPRLQAEISYRVAGEGPAVVLLHGWANSWHMWEQTMLALAGAGYRAYAPDHIGCGESSKPWLLYTPNDHLRYVEDFVQALGLDRFILGGHSQGGHIALSYALAHPDQVSRLILADPAYSPVGQIVPTRAQLMLAIVAMPVLGELSLIGTPARLLRWVVDRPWGGFHRSDRLAPEFLNRVIVDYLINASPRVCLAVHYLLLFSLPGLRRLRADADLKPRLREVAMPALLVWGRRDALLRPSSFDELAAALPQVVARPLADAGHTPQVESPREFEAAVLEFLAA